MNAKIGVSQFFGFLGYAFARSSSRGVITIIFLFGTFTLCNESTHEIFKKSTDYLLFLVLYPISCIGFGEVLYGYFWKGYR